MKYLLLFFTVSTLFAQRTPLKFNGVVVNNPDLTNTTGVTYTVNGSIVSIDLPQDIRTNASPTFSGLSLNATSNVLYQAQLTTRPDGSLGIYLHAGTNDFVEAELMFYVAQDGAVSISGQTNRLTVSGGVLLFDGAPVGTVNPTAGFVPFKSGGGFGDSWVYQNGTNSLIVSNSLTGSSLVIDLSSATDPYAYVRTTNGNFLKLVGNSTGNNAVVSSSGLLYLTVTGGASSAALTTSALIGGGLLDLGSISASGVWNDIYSKGNIYLYGTGAGTTNNELLMIDHGASSGVVFDSQKNGSGTARDFIFKIDGVEKARIGASGLAQKTKVDIYTSTGANTWTKPDGAKSVTVLLVAGGGGGGSGRKGAAGTVRCGGGGGAGSGWTIAHLSAALLGSSETVTVGAGGTGGASVAADSTDGNSGGSGSVSSFGAWAKCSLTGGGGGGTASAGAAGIAGSGGNNPASKGGAASGTGGNGANGTSQTGSSAGSGGAGGGITSGNAASNGGNGGDGSITKTIQPTAGTAGTAGGTVAGGNGDDNNANVAMGGAGGGGGAASTSGNAGSGGNGGIYGGGGGGGGASVDSTGDSGAGGNGANGIVIVITDF